VGLNRFDARRDGNESDLLKAARLIGAMWEEAGPLDGWVFWRGLWVPVENKNPQGRNRYTDAQILFLARCKERGAPVWTWRCVEDVFESLGARQTA
jgi:hypothetical protein